MKNWPTMPLRELVLPTEQRNPKENPTEEFSYVDIASVDNETKSIVTTKRIIGAEAPSRARKVIRTGDVIVSTVRPNLNAVALVPTTLDNQICSTGFSVLRPSPKVMSGYLFAFVRSPLFIDHLVARTTGANYPAVNDSEVKDTPLSMPPLPQQERIVKLLDEADELRKLRAQADHGTATLIPTLFQQMFGSGKFKPASVADLTSLVTSGSTPRGGEEVYTGEGPYFIRSQNVQMNRLDLTDAACLPMDIHRQMSRTKVAQGDVLINITGASIGRVTWVDKLDREANVSQHVCLIRPKPNLLNPVYLSVFISLPRTQHFILQIQAGASRQALNHQQVRTLEIPSPPMTLQKHFAQRVAEIREVEAAQGTSRTCLHALFQSILHRAFNGELTHSP